MPRPHHLVDSSPFRMPARRRGWGTIRILRSDVEDAVSRVPRRLGAILEVRPGLEDGHQLLAIGRPVDDVLEIDIVRLHVDRSAVLASMPTIQTLFPFKFHWSFAAVTYAIRLPSGENRASYPTPGPGSRPARPIGVHDDVLPGVFSFLSGDGGNTHEPLTVGGPIRNLICLRDRQTDGMGAIRVDPPHCKPVRLGEIPRALGNDFDNQQLLAIRRPDRPPADVADLPGFRVRAEVPQPDRARADLESIGPVFVEGETRGAGRDADLAIAVMPFLIGYSAIRVQAFVTGSTTCSPRSCPPRRSSAMN